MYIVIVMAPELNVKLTEGSLTWRLPFTLIQLHSSRLVTLNLLRLRARPISGCQ
jgi:hypothetical protein